MTQTPLQCGRQLPRVEPEGPGFALVSDLAIAPDNEQTIRPRRVLLLNPIVDPIQQSGDLDVELANARACHILPFCRGSRIPEDHTLFDIALHLPDVAWVSLRDVDHVERRLLVVPLV